MGERWCLTIATSRFLRCVFSLKYLSLFLVAECHLELWPLTANVSWHQVPARWKNCRLSFPPGTGERRGLVVELTRLNVPCPAGGFLQFSSSSRHQPLCGKLEELPATGRLLYFPPPPPLSAAPAVNLRGSPVFAFSYRLVDYCYNVTLTAKNDSFVLRPSSGLHCTFKIHLPYGNRVYLRLQIGFEDKEADLLPSSNSILDYTETSGDKNLPTLPQLSNSDPDPRCDGLLIRLWDGTVSWYHCAISGDPDRQYSVLSLGNSVTLRVVAHHAMVPVLKLWYHAEAIPDLIQQCSFGWVALRQFCITVVDDTRVTWHEAEQECGRRGGHLASIRSEEAQATVDNLLLYSPGYRDHNSYWVGASDKTYEGDFRWSDGFPFHYTNWFPGWAHHDHYSKQPNDDGVSDQDCVELRRVYPLPTSSFRLAHSFMWNDMDCAARNFFICERLRTGEPAEEGWPPECNRSVELSREQPRATIVSPGFPRRYPDNAECDTQVTAPPGYRLVLDFEEFVLEEERDCSYDFLEISEDPVPGSSEPSPSPSKLCGDWSSKLKLKRYKSKGPKLRMRFVSDYSHHYGGFKARVSMENAMECSDDRFELFNSSCYLFVSYPEVTWRTAQQTCRDKKAELASIQSPDEENFVTTNIRKSAEYSTSAVYWLGGQLVGEEWKWMDESPMSFSAWLPGQAVEPSATCLGVQWVSSPSLLLSGLYWQPQRCTTVGGYVCKRVSQIAGSSLYLNRTINGTEGFLTSPNYPSHYNHNLDYWVRLIGPERTRIVVQFTRIDLELQQECLYDYVELRSGGDLGRDGVVRWCGSHETEMDRFNFISENNEAIIHFHSDYSLSGTGFSSTWKAVDVSGCPLLTLTAREGSLTSPNYPHFLMAHLDCATTILAPVGRKVWLEFVDYDLGARDWRNGVGYGNDVPEAELELDLGAGTQAFRPFQLAAHLTDGAFLSAGERLQVRLRTADRPHGIGFKAIYRTVSQVREERVLDLRNITLGTLLHLNYPAAAPPYLDFVQHLIAPLGHKILLELHHVMVSDNTACPDRAGIIEVSDNYADPNGTWWFLCEVSEPDDPVLSAPLAIASYLNTLHVRQRSGARGVRLNATVRVQPDSNYKLKLVRISEDSSVESCHPNPCQNGGKCLSIGNRRSCQCTSHFTGMFCALTLCEMEPCLFGQCQLTDKSYTCHCQPGYTGINCEQKQRPCADNPCEGRGECIEKSNTYHCICHAWMEGPRCERRMLNIPYKPLSERMLQEPFWLGLITVTVVLGVIGLVWCAKRHLPEKLEKLLAEEADRNRPSASGHSRPPSVREQLTATSGTTVVVVPSPQPGCPRSLFGRLGIRKPSLLSLTSPHANSHHPTTATARTFSLDDLLKPPPKRTPSPRKKRNNSTPTKKNIAEKKQILQQLISPSINQQPRKVSLGELIQLSERKLKQNGENTSGGEGDEKETTLSEGATALVASSASRSSIDAKLEKKVTFARLLSKVSAEMSSSSEVEMGAGASNLTRHPQLSGLPRSASTPPSPAVDQRSPHSTSSNQGSDSMSSLDVTLPLSTGTTVSELLANRRPNRLLQGGRPVKNTSADSILAMFRNFSSATAVTNNQRLSPSTTPTASSPQDDVAGSDESSTSSIPTPLSSSSLTLDSPPMTHHSVFRHSNTIEVPVLDALSAHKSAPCGSNLLHPPTILLEVPSAGSSKCLSPIHEVPTPLSTPLPSPAITPVMPRCNILGRMSRDEDIRPQPLQLPAIMITTSEPEEEAEEEEANQSTETGTVSTIPKDKKDPSEGENTCRMPRTLTSIPFRFKVRPPSIRDLVAAVTVDEDEMKVDQGAKHDDCTSSESGCCQPHPPVIPILTVEEPSPTRHYPSDSVPGSPPPQRGGGLMEMFPGSGKGPRRHLKELDKPNSLDLPCPPPLITVTCNMSEADSDTDSPAAKNAGSHPGVGGGGVGMCYLSPFSMCTRGDRTASESNLSSSGYSSMASPGPSRCGSNNPLCPSEVDDPPGPNNSGPGSGMTSLHSQSSQRRPSPLLRTPTSTTDSRCMEGEGRRPPESHTLQGGRGRSDSETLSDDLFVESNDEGIGTDHLDEKIEDGELKSAKELEVFIGKELLENGKTLLGLPLLPTSPGISSRGGSKCGSVEADLDTYKLPPCKASLQLPSIVVQSDSSGCDKHLSPVSSRSESPLSDKTCGLGRFSPMFYGRHFTDSDGLYDCPSSDCPLNRVPANNTVHQHRKSTTGRRRERRCAPVRPTTGSKTPSPTKTMQHLLDVPGKETSISLRSNVPRKPSPKRSRIRTQQPVSSSSSSESLNSTREMNVREKPNIWAGSDTKDRRMSIEASGEDTGEDVATHMLPKVLWDELPKPQRKISRLRTIGHQIRFLRRLELSLKRRERLVSPTDSCCDDDDSPPLLSPLISSNLSEMHKSSSFGQLPSQTTAERARGWKRSSSNHKHAGELLIPHDEQTWRAVRVTSSSGHTD
ncbi:uncharacterized protein [Anabrus simplex]|uniref:uncharacterized protein n=1 Tax=Anabrus simplex TaxID=316456 RepID=UPI0035A29FB9